MNHSIALLVLVASSTADAQPIMLVPGEGFEVERYEVTLRPDLATTAVAGTETIVVRGTSDRTTHLAFTPNALRISDATANARPVQVSSDKHAIAFALPRALREGETTTLRFRIAGIPARGVTGVAGGVYTSYFACDWMVCLQDAPGDKAHFALDLLLPAGATSIGAGRAGPKTASPGGLVRHRWRSPRPLSPYLYAFAAGRFAGRSIPIAQGELLYLDATSGDVDLGALFAETPAMIAFFAGKAGMPLPDRRYAQVLVPGREAQEAAGFSLIGEAELALEGDDPSSAWIIAHELAHQWWGNLVTCETWRDFWLNEGITTFMVAAWKQHRFGEVAYRQELDVARNRLKRARDANFDKPLAWSGKYPSLGVRRAVQYSKGTLFLAHLRQSIGDAAFWKGLRLFTRRHAGATVTSKDFQNAMEQASKRDLSPMFAEWVYGD